MQDHLKERLTGAAILVAVVVLLVPELFHGRAPADGGAAASGTGPPVRSVTIDLRDAAGTRPLTENAPAAAPATAAPAAATPPPAVSAPPATARAPSIVTAAPGTARASAPANVAAAPATAAKPAAAPATPTVTPSASHGGAVKSGWTVQLGSFSRREFADRLVKDAAAKGFTVEVAGPDDRGLYRVRSPPRADRAAALALKQKMQASGYKPIVNKAP